MDRAEFYSRVSSLLDTEDTFVEPRRYRRRWGQRTPGNGRFEGHGIVRWFGPNVIHVALTVPRLQCTFTDPMEAISGIAMQLLIEESERLGLYAEPETVSDNS